ncbi:MAG: 1-acyl-sn-glycerol-3-phosphate acyltransferase, partial [Proteobacteria bacterium]|nr:1-acyl-sn-glycerol-3-phosphate acyltransferase [Pseudomonadota bacterium]
INFVKIAGAIAASKAGKELNPHFSGLPESWANAGKISALAVELTMAQLKKEGKDPDRHEIETLVEEIEIKYDRATHIDAATTLTLLFNQVFDQQNKTLPFTSLDGRDLAHISELREYRKKGMGVVYLINHSSHLDEFLVDILWQHLYLGLPVFAAGQNMMSIKSIAKLLMTGSYVVLRQGASKHQMSALYNYCRAISLAGEQQGIFLEAWRGGARSRDGSLRYPKRLITLRGAIDVDTDLVVQPIALSFSAVPEDLPLCSRKSSVSWIRGLGFFRTLFRIPFNPKTFLWKSAKNLYGRAYVTVPKPFLLSQLKEQHKQDKSGIHLDEFVALSAIKQIARSKKIMASQLVALGLLKARKEGRMDIIESVTNEMTAIKEYHLQTFGVKPDFEDFILHHSAKDIVADGLEMLARRRVIKRWPRDKNGYPVVIDEAALSYYATHADRRLYSPTADQNIVVVGAGNWGFALACLIGNRILDDKKYNNASLTIFDPSVEIARKMGRDRNGKGRFSENLLPKNVFVTSDFSSAFRKASDVIIASKPSDFMDNFQKILSVSAQPFKLMIATRGFIPDTHTIPYLAAADLLEKFNRKDVQLYTLTSPIIPEDLVENHLIKGILAGADDGMELLSDLFDTPFVSPFISKDPVGAQTADILSRIYAFWINYAQSAGIIQNSLQTGYLMAQVADEAAALAINIGGHAESFEAGSIPWTATLTALYLDGLWKEFGQKIGMGVKKGKSPHKMLLKIQMHYKNEGIHLHSIADMESALACARRYNLSMPVLEEAFETFKNPKP